jgi:histone acetyltransferase (RNA polymerase elongator complex component)
LSKSHYIIPIFVSHQGCPHNCVFCNQNSIAGNYERIDSSYVHNRVQEYLKTINCDGATIEISFFGGTFTAISMELQKELLSAAKHYKDLNKVHLIRLSTRPDYINVEILENLRAYSVDIIELGVQSMDEEVLIKSGRGHTRGDVINASSLIKRYGFTLGHQVMLGLPGDTPQKDIDTVKSLIELMPDLFRIYPALVIKDTPMEIMHRVNKYDPYPLNTAIEVAKELFYLLIHNNIKIIRVGLQATDNINVGGDIIAGPFHPAFRELVEGSIFCDMILQRGKEAERNMCIHINKRDISKLYANKKQFFNDMKKQLNTIKLQVCSDDDVERGVLNIKCDDNWHIMSIKDFAEEILTGGNINIT